MREIKFRAWDKINGMVYNPAFQVLSAGQFEINRCFEQDYPKFMQYTGLKDKNGKEVYEGDIVKDWENIDLYEVVWNRRYACFELNRLTFGNDTGQEIDNLHLDLEIIGNIYENKDLLEAKEI